MSGLEKGVYSEEKRRKLALLLEEEQERVILRYMKLKKSEESYNPRKIHILIKVRHSTEMLLMACAMYCIVMSQVYSIATFYDPVYYVGIMLCSFLIANFNILRVILTDHIDREFNRCPSTQRKFQDDFKIKLLENFLHTCVILIFPNPFFDLLPRYKINYMNILIDANSIAFILQTSKLYFIMLWLLEGSSYYSEDAFRVCRMFGTSRNWMFVIKARMKRTPITFLFLCLVTVVYNFSYLIYICEHNMPVRFGMQPYIADFQAAVWLVCVTVTTGRFSSLSSWIWRHDSSHVFWETDSVLCLHHRNGSLFDHNQ